MLENPYKLIEELTTDKEKEIFGLDSILVNIGALLIKYRIEHGLSRDDLANKLKISEKTLEKLELGEYNPSVKLLWNIAKELNFDFNIIFKEKEE